MERRKRKTKLRARERFIVKQRGKGDRWEIDGGIKEKKAKEEDSKESKGETGQMAGKD